MTDVATKPAAQRGRAGAAATSSAIAHPLSRRRTSSGIQSVAKAVTILHCLARERGAVSVSALSAELHLHKSTVSRLLLTLEEGGLVTYDSRTGHYRLGFGLLEMAGLVLEGIDLRTIAQPHLLALSEASRETVNLGVLDRDEVVNISQLLSPQTIKHVGWIGRRNPLHCTSGGRLFLAFGPPDLFQRALAAGLKAYTPATITDPDQLAAVLGQVRQQGYALVRDEFELGVTAIAAPIFDGQGHITAVCNATGPSFRFPNEIVPVRAAQVREAAVAISRELQFANVV